MAMSSSHASLREKPAPAGIGASAVMVMGQETPALLDTPDIPVDRWIRMLPLSSGAPKCNVSPGACPRMVGTDGVPGTREKLVAM